MSNLYAILKKLMPDAPLLVGVVQSSTGAGYVVRLPDGAYVIARGSSAIGATVFIRDGVIEGAAPSLPVETIEV
jgi:hypothetical protein